MVFAKRTEATWNVNLYANCPYCEELQDIFNEWGEQECWNEVKVGESKRLKTTHGNEDLICVCKKCKKDFVISKVEY